MFSYACNTSYLEYIVHSKLAIYTYYISSIAIAILSHSFSINFTENRFPPFLGLSFSFIDSKTVTFVRISDHIQIKPAAVPEKYLHLFQVKYGAIQADCCYTSSPYFFILCFLLFLDFHWLINTSSSCHIMRKLPIIMQVYSW